MCILCDFVCVCAACVRVCVHMCVRACVCVCVGGGVRVWSPQNYYVLICHRSCFHFSIPHVPLLRLISPCGLTAVVQLLIKATVSVGYCKLLQFNNWKLTQISKCSLIATFQIYICVLETKTFIGFLFCILFFHPVIPMASQLDKREVPRFSLYG